MNKPTVKHTTDTFYSIVVNLPLPYRIVLAILWIMKLAVVMTIIGLGIHAYVFQGYVSHKINTLATDLSIVSVWLGFALIILFMVSVAPKIFRGFDEPE